MREHSSTQPQHHQQYQHQTAKLQLKSEQLEMEAGTRWHNMACCDLFTFALMAATSEGLGGAKSKSKKRGEENQGLKQETAK